MILYHYSKDPHSSLKSKRMQVTNKSMGHIPFNLDFEYDDNISFFLDPIPAKLLPALFNNRHPVWTKGVVLYEHIVDASKLPNVIGFELVESANKTKFFDEFVNKHKWYSDDPGLLKLWWDEITPKLVSWGEVGSYRDALISIIRKNKGRTEMFFKKAVQRKDFEHNRNKYAANVPHLMVYPPSGVIDVLSINKIIMGSDNRMPYNKSFSEAVSSSIPITFNW